MAEKANLFINRIRIMQQLLEKTFGLTHPNLIILMLQLKVNLCKEKTAFEDKVNERARV